MSQLLYHRTWCYSMFKPNFINLHQFVINKVCNMRSNGDWISKLWFGPWSFKLGIESRTPLHYEKLSGCWIHIPNSLPVWIAPSSYLSFLLSFSIIKYLMITGQHKLYSHNKLVIVLLWAQKNHIHYFRGKKTINH